MNCYQSPSHFILGVTAGCIIYIWLPNQTVPNILWGRKPSVPDPGPQIYLHVAYPVSWETGEGLCVSRIGRSLLPKGCLRTKPFFLADIRKF